jgi:hypothetical protein
LLHTDVLPYVRLSIIVMSDAPEHGRPEIPEERPQELPPNAPEPGVERPSEIPPHPPGKD